MSFKARLGFAAASTLPLLAPYQLWIQPAWTDIPSAAWLFAVAIGLGAIMVSVLLVLVAVFGLNRQVEFDVISRTIRVTESHLLHRPREHGYSFADVVKLEVICHDWSDGPSSYQIRLTPKTGKPLDFGRFEKRLDADSIRSSLQALLGCSEYPAA
jgi:hypothetical protein